MSEPPRPRFRNLGVRSLGVRSAAVFTALAGLCLAAVPVMLRTADAVGGEQQYFWGLSAFFLVLPVGVGALVLAVVVSAIAAGMTDDHRRRSWARGCTAAAVLAALGLVIGVAWSHEILLVIFALPAVVIGGTAVMVNLDSRPRPEGKRGDRPKPVRPTPVRR